MHQGILKQFGTNVKHDVMVCYAQDLNHRPLPLAPRSRSHLEVKGITVSSCFYNAKFLSVE
jgi:hypothetical protein